GVAEALVGAAVALGWLQGNGSGLNVTSAAQGRVGDPMLAAFQQALSTSNNTYWGVKNAAKAVAKQKGPELEAILAQAGLARGVVPRFVNAGSIVAAGAVLGFIGLVRCVR